MDAPTLSLAKIATPSKNAGFRSPSQANSQTIQYHCDTRLIELHIGYWRS